MYLLFLLTGVFLPQRGTGMQSGAQAPETNSDFPGLATP